LHPGEIMNDDRANEGEDTLVQIVRNGEDPRDFLYRSGFGMEAPLVDDDISEKTTLPDPDRIRIYEEEGILHAEGSITNDNARAAILEILLNYKHTQDSAMHLTKMVGRIKLNGKDLTPTMIREFANLSFKQARDDVDLLYSHLGIGKNGIDNHYFNSKEWKELVAKLSDPVARAEFQGEDGEYAQNLEGNLIRTRPKANERHERNGHSLSDAASFEKLPEESTELLNAVRAARNGNAIERQVTEPNIIIDKSLYRDDSASLDAASFEEEDTQPDIRPVRGEDGQMQFYFMKGMKNDSLDFEEDTEEFAVQWHEQLELPFGKVDELHKGFNNWGDTITDFVSACSGEDAGPKRPGGFKAALGAMAILAVLSYSGNDRHDTKQRDTIIIPESQVETIYVKPPTLDEFVTKGAEASGSGFWEKFDDKMADGFHKASLAFLGGDGNGLPINAAAKPEDKKDVVQGTQDSDFNNSPTVQKKHDDMIHAADVPDKVKRQYLRAFVRGKVGRSVSLSKNKRLNLHNWATGQMAINAAHWKGTRVDGDRRNDYRRGEATEEQASMAEAWLLDYTGNDLDHFMSKRGRGIGPEDVDFANLGPNGQKLLDRMERGYSTPAPAVKHVAKVRKHKKLRSPVVRKKHKTVKKPVLQPPTKEELARMARSDRPEKAEPETKVFEPPVEIEGPAPSYGFKVHKPETFEEKRDYIMTNLLQRIAAKPSEHAPISTFLLDGPVTLTEHVDWRFEMLHEEFPDKGKEISDAKKAAFMAIGDTTCIGNYVEIQLRTLEERCKYRIKEGREPNDITEYKKNFLDGLSHTCRSYVNRKVPDVKNANGESVRDYLIKGNEEKLREAGKSLDIMIDKSKVVKEDVLKTKKHKKQRRARRECGPEEICPFTQNLYNDLSTQDVLEASLARQVMGGSLSEQDALVKAGEFYNLEGVTPESMADSYLKVQNIRNAEKEFHDVTLRDVIRASLARQVMNGSISEEAALEKGRDFYGFEDITAEAMADSYVKVQYKKQRDKVQKSGGIDVDGLVSDIGERIDEVFTEYDPAIQYAA